MFFDSMVVILIILVLVWWLPLIVSLFFMMMGGAMHQYTPLLVCGALMLVVKTCQNVCDELKKKFLKSECAK